MWFTIYLPAHGHANVHAFSSFYRTCNEIPSLSESCMITNYKLVTWKCNFLNIKSIKKKIKIQLFFGKNKSTLIRSKIQSLDFKYTFIYL